MRVMKLPRSAMPGNVERQQPSSGAPAFEAAMREAAREGKKLYTLSGALHPQGGEIGDASLDDDGCPICVAMREGGEAGDVPFEMMGEAAGFSWSARPLEASELEASSPLMTAYREATAAGLGVVIPPLSETETAAILARELLGVRHLLDRHRRFQLEVWHPDLGLIRLQGSLKGARMKVRYCAPKAPPEGRGTAAAVLRGAREAIAEALAEEGLALVSFLPERADGR